MITTKFNKNETASFDTDAQNGFTFNCPNELPVEGGNEIAAPLNAQATFACFRAGSKDAHSPQADFVGKTWPRHCEVGTEGFELLDGLPHPGNYDFFVWKGIEKSLHPYGACYHHEDWQTRKMSTGIIEVLRSEGIKNVIVGGLATEYCVKNTALQFQDAGFQVILNLAACRGIAQADIEKALAEMREAGIIIVDDVATCGIFN
jgi:nicotinamidase/pyrazinamidase